MLLTTCSLGLGELRSSNSTPRHHPPRQIQKAKHLFTEQGIVVPIVVDENHRIIDGHLRLAVAQELGGETLNATVVSEASPAQLIELELVLNRLAGAVKLIRTRIGLLAQPKSDICLMAPYRSFFLTSGLYAP